jgi:hypothetical protein
MAMGKSMGLVHMNARPPVGMNLFLASYRFGRPLPEVVRAVGCS